MSLNCEIGGENKSMTNMNEFYKDLSKIAKSQRTFLNWKALKLQEMENEILENEDIISSASRRLKRIFEKLSNIQWYTRYDRTWNDVVNQREYQTDWLGKPASIEEANRKAKLHYTHNPEDWIEWGGTVGLTRYLKIINKYKRLIKNREDSWSWNSLKRRKADFRRKYDTQNNRDLYMIYDKVFAIQYSVRDDIEF